MEDIEKMLSEISAEVFSAESQEPAADTTKLFPEPKLFDKSDDDDLAMV